MEIISNQEIIDLSISSYQCVQWVKEAFLIKDKCQLPPKISLHPKNGDFVNTMPCLLPEEYHTYGCKIISRVSGTIPALKSKMLMVDTTTGGFTTLIDCEWITAMRTGAVATLAIQTLKKESSKIYSFVGLGVIGNAVIKCLLPLIENENITIKLKRYKDQAEKTIMYFANIFPKVKFEIVDTMEALVQDADVVVSSITYADTILVNDLKLFKPGVLVVPVHTRGFQNCDTVFDKVFADDEGHVKGFQYFDKFKKFGELSEVLTGKIKGRETNSEKILSYNIGLGIFDVYFGYKISEIMSESLLINQGWGG